MKAVKRGNSWRVQVYDYTDEQGKKHLKSFTADTKEEALLRAMEWKTGKAPDKPRDMTVGKAVDRYIEIKALLSPTTLDAYRAYRQYAFPDLMHRKVSELNDIIVQSAINDETKRIGQKGKPVSAKTVKNEWALVSGSLKTICHREFHVTLPKAQKHIKEYPDPKTVIDAVKGSDIELVCMLSIWLSFSMSEIRGLKCSDIKNGHITINRTMVDTRDGIVVKDDAKQESRLRRHALPAYIMELIEQTDVYKQYLETGEDGFLIDMNRRQIFDRFQKLCEQNGIELSLHGLRHLNASVMINRVGVPLRIAQERGGWATDYVMLNTYTHSFSSDREYYDMLIDRYFEALLKGEEEGGKGL